MFTGLVQKVGTLRSRFRNAGGWSLRVASEKWEDELTLGESVAVQGACLTVTEIHSDGFTADILDETLRRTALESLHEGSLLNLERALRLGDRLGGHIVSGHVDATGRLLSIRPAGRDVSLEVECGRDIAALTVEKGSIAIDGVSLTVTAVTATTLAVAVIPHTLAATSLRERREGDNVNLESDILGKYVAKLLGRQTSGGITESFLAEHGFI